MTMTQDRPATTTRARAYPFVNDWRKRCWVARPTGKADRDYVYAREFLRGRPNKSEGTLSYTLDDLGGPGWIVAKDARGRRALVELGELEWVDHGDVAPADVLRVVRAGSWDGARCPECEYGAVIDGETICPACETDQAESDRARAELDAMPDTQPF